MVNVAIETFARTSNRNPVTWFRQSGLTITWLKASKIGESRQRSDFHRDPIQAVQIAPPLPPGHGSFDQGGSPDAILSVQVRVVAVIVPPAAEPLPGAVAEKGREISGPEPQISGAELKISGSETQKYESDTYPLYTALLWNSRWIGNPTNHSSTTVSVSPSCLSACFFNHVRFSESN